MSISKSAPYPFLIHVFLEKIRKTHLQRYPIISLPHLLAFAKSPSLTCKYTDGLQARIGVSPRRLLLPATRSRVTSPSRHSPSSVQGEDLQHAKVTSTSPVIPYVAVPPRAHAKKTSTTLHDSDHRRGQQGGMAWLFLATQSDGVDVGSKWPSARQRGGSRTRRHPLARLRASARATSARRGGAVPHDTERRRGREQLGQGGAGGMVAWRRPDKGTSVLSTPSVGAANKRKAGGAALFLTTPSDAGGTATRRKPHKVRSVRLRA